MGLPILSELKELMGRLSFLCKRSLVTPTVECIFWVMITNALIELEAQLFACVVHDIFLSGLKK